MRCIWCDQPFWGDHGCTPYFFLYGGEYSDAIKFGDERDRFILDKSFERCPDCGVYKGAYHHIGCTYLRCPVCGSGILPGEFKCSGCGAKVVIKKEEDENN